MDLMTEQNLDRQLTGNSRVILPDKDSWDVSQPIIVVKCSACSKFLFFFSSFCSFSRIMKKVVGNRSGCPTVGDRIVELIYIDSVVLAQFKKTLGPSWVNYQYVLHIVLKFLELVILLTRVTWLPVEKAYRILSFEVCRVFLIPN